jgi:hypothetical protein
MDNNSEGKERFFVFDDFQAKEVYGLTNLNAKLAAKSEPVLRQEVYWGTKAFEDFLADVPAKNRSPNSTELKRNYRNAALVAEMELNRRSTKQAASLVWKTTVISFIFSLVVVSLAAVLGAFFAGFWDGPPD